MKIVFMLEEPSAKSMLQVIVPKIIPEYIQVQYVSFDGKTNLEKELERKLRWWLEPDTCFLIMRDQDLEDCRVLKDRLRKIVEKSGKENISVIRIACHELETFFLGDLDAVEKGLSISGIAKMQNTQKYRNPDDIEKPSNEIKRIAKGCYSKIQGAKRISPYLKLDGSNRSTSFNQLIRGIQKAIAKLGDESECS